MQEPREGRADDWVLLTGATGLVGSRLIPELAKRFAGIRMLSRSAAESPTQSTEFGTAVEKCRWDGVDPGPSALAGVDAVIHLAGEPIFGGLPTAARRERIRSSRIDSTRALVDRILACPQAHRPTTLICASAVGIYGDRGEEALSESSAIGSGFLAEVCRDWEAEAERARTGGLRVVSLRIGVVLASEGGALSLMKIPFGLGVGGRLGTGEQFFPWIHGADLVGSILWCLSTDLDGPVNAVAPEQVRNLDLTRALGSVLGRPALLPVPAFAVNAVLGEISGELLGSKRVEPTKLQDSGYSFRFGTLHAALVDELG